MYYKIEQLKNILANHKSCVFSLDYLCSSALEYIQHLEGGIDRCCELAKKFEAAAPKWISVKDDVPAKVITPCLVYAYGYIQAACWSYDKWTNNWWFYVDGEYEPGVTHWMDMPNPPEDS